MTIITLIGEKNAGKTTLLNLLKTAQFSEGVEESTEDLILDCDELRIRTANYDNKITIKDCSSVKEKKIESVLKTANGVIILFDIDNEDSYKKAVETYIPIIKKYEEITSVWLVGNKSDLVVSKSSEPYSSFSKFNEPGIIKYEISCKHYLNVTKLLNNVIEEISYPLKPLRTKTQKLRVALTRIFRILDADNNGYINKEEFNEIYSKLFHKPIENKEVETIYTEVLKNEKGMDLENFISLNKKCIDYSVEMPWYFLYYFSYDRNINLKYKTCDRDNEKILNNLNSFFLKYKGTNDLISLEKIKEIFGICDDKDKLLSRFLNKRSNEEGVSLEEWNNAWKALSRERDYDRFYRAYLQIGYTHDSSVDEFESEEKTHYNLFNLLTITGFGALVTAGVIYIIRNKKKL